MRLGWRTPRPNDYQGPDSRPLKDSFASLQQHMTWPHFKLTIDTQTIDGSLVNRTITAVDDPYSLIRANDTIQVPRDFDTWMFVGTAGVYITAAGAVRGVMTWAIGGTEVPGVGEVWTPVGATDLRLMAATVTPVKKGDVISIQVYLSVNDFIDTGSATGFFLPMT